MIKRIFTLFLATVIAICPLSSFASYEIKYSAVSKHPILSSIKSGGATDNSILTPIEGHPRVNVNADYIKYMKENKDSDMLRESYQKILALALKDLPAQPKGGFVNSAIGSQLSARAFMYLMGEVDKKHARDTYKFTLEYVKNAKSSDVNNYMNRYKELGQLMLIPAAYVFDWCFDAFTESQRMALATAIHDQLYAEDQVKNPGNVSTWEQMNNVPIGWPQAYFGIATNAIYDYYPDDYNAVMFRIQGTFAQAAKRFFSSGSTYEGSIAYTKAHYFIKNALMLNRMGLDETTKYGNMLPVGYFFLYARTPYGAQLKVGDSYTYQSYQYGDYANVDDVYQNMGGLAALYNDPVMTYMYLRTNLSTSSVAELVWKYSDKVTEAKLPDDLPLAFESTSPRDGIVAKTSWQEGYDSPQVTAYLNMATKRTGDHDHPEQGSFQIHYKGPLTIPGGYYTGSGYADDHYVNYMSDSISKNAVLVVHPDEIFENGSYNNGGLMHVTTTEGKRRYIFNFEEYWSDRNIWAYNLGTYIGPNANTPAFSYGKIDLTPSYWAAKMNSMKRSMVFMDTFNPTYPGVMIVYDRVNATSEKYPKIWLLQGVDEPKINGDKVTITNANLEEEANGKLVNVTLLPENVNITAVGGTADYRDLGGNPHNTHHANYVSQFEKMSPLFKSGWRAEVRPETDVQDETFLNAMFVADADTTAPDLEMTKVDDGTFVGVVTLDRQVMFSKTGDVIKSAFNIEVKDNNKGGKMLVLMTDVKECKWNIKGNGLDIIVEAKASDNAFAFEAAPGVYSVTPAADDKSVTEINWPQAEKEKTGDFTIKKGNEFLYMRNPNKLVDGVPFVPASFLSINLGINARVNGNSITIKNKDKTVVLTAGSTDYTVQSGSNTSAKKLTNAPFVDDKGVFYLSLDATLCSQIGITKSEYIPRAKMLTVTMPVNASNKPKNTIAGIDESKVYTPIDATVTSTDGSNIVDNLFDRDLGTRWSSSATSGESVTIKVGETPVDIHDVRMAFYNGDIRNWMFDVQVSSDGATFTTALANQVSKGGTKNAETFTLPAGTKATHVRIVGRGEKVTNYQGTSITELAVCSDKVVNAAAAGSTLPGVNEANVLTPIEVEVSSTEGSNIVDNLFDRDLQTRWSSEATSGESVTFKMGDEAVAMSSVQIAFYNGKIRNWKFDILVSDDGATFTPVLTGLKSKGGTVDPETFTLPAGTKAKYLRLVGNGEEVTNYQGTSITEFIINK